MSLTKKGKRAWSTEKKFNIKGRIRSRGKKRRGWKRKSMTVKTMRRYPDCLRCSHSVPNVGKKKKVIVKTLNTGSVFIF